MTRVRQIRSRKALGMQLAVASLCAAASLAAAEPLDIGSRLELFVDDYLIGELQGDARLRLHRPEPKQVVLVTGRPWEGNTCAY